LLALAVPPGPGTAAASLGGSLGEAL
jgi:hypothetical protein